MTEVALQTPVLLLAFNRPEPTRKNLERILAAHPERLYVAADGPRSHVASDQEACRQVRQIVRQVADRTDLHTDFAPVNLGLRPRVISALDWVMERETEVIVLEDDCHPLPSFFTFCSTLLERYASDERVGSICGSTAVSLTRRGPRYAYDYHFSQVGLPWGWATWRRAWKDMDRDLMCWPELRRSGWLERHLGPVTARQWRTMLDYSDEDSSWWVRWMVTHWAQSRVAAVPRISLVENVGIGPDATHTQAGSTYARFGGMPVAPLETPLSHPPHFAVDPDLDQVTLEALLPYPSWRRGLRQLAMEGPGSLKRRFR